MKQFKLYFYSTFILILTSISIAIMYVAIRHQDITIDGPPSYVRYANMLERIMQVIVTFGPLQVSLHFRERKKVTNLFFFTAIAGSLSFITSTLLVFLQIKPELPSGIWLTLDRVVAVIMLLSAVAFIIGCYGIKDLTIRNAFRWIGHTYIFAIIVGIIYVIFRIEHWPILQGQAIPHLAQVPENIVFLFLLYRSNLMPEAKANWQTEIASIGTPES